MLINTTPKPNGYAMAALISICVSAVLASVLYWGAYLGNTGAIDALMKLSLPQYNFFAALLPEDLSQTRWGMELILGVVIMQGTVALFALYALWSFLRKR